MSRATDAGRSAAEAGDEDPTELRMAEATGGLVPEEERSARGTNLDVGVGRAGSEGEGPAVVRAEAAAAERAEEGRWVLAAA
jgi:hypothetical protein